MNATANPSVSRTRSCCFRTMCGSGAGMKLIPISCGAAGRCGTLRHGAPDSQLLQSLSQLLFARKKAGHTVNGFPDFHLFVGGRRGNLLIHIDAPPASLNPESGISGAVTAWGLKDTSSRPPKDLGGTLRRTSKTTLRSYDSRASGDRDVPIERRIHRRARMRQGREDGVTM